MKSKLTILFLVLFFVACKDKKDSQQVTADKHQPSSNTHQTEAVNKQANGDKTLLGDWYQEYALLDQNGNAVLDPDEREGTRSTMGINYFQFKDDGRCLYDSDMKFKGTYQIIEENGKRTLKVTVNGFGETYTYTIADPVTEELILYSSGAFMIYKKK